MTRLTRRKFDTSDATKRRIEDRKRDFGMTNRSRQRRRVGATTLERDLGAE